ncbi:cytochrome b-c1 complex subunit 2, mitochondrial-like [Ptychodera flava]|uniref:cytochrome b-c1 complex subunit 2, mitochondrial-like n=1 Tax=Ptychodera flava TaxID=63121 RepID=UPI00396A1EEC
MIPAKVTTARPLFANISRRNLAAWSAVAKKKVERIELPKEDVKITKLQNGLTVASLENHSPVSKIGVIINAGSRYEDANNLGVTHYLRACSHLATQGASTFAITRGIGDVGGSLEVTTSRDHATYAVQALRGEPLESSLSYLTQVLSNPLFRSWEIADNVGRLQLDAAIAKQQTQVDLMERLHAAAFRNTLANSIYCPEHNIGKLSPSVLHDFRQKHYTSSNMALVGLGVDHGQLLSYAESLNLQLGAVTAKAAPKYAGGEHSRQQSNDPLTQVVMATEGVALGSDDLLVSGVLQHYLNGAPNIKRGTTVATSKLNQAVAKSTSLPFSTSCINVNYTDSGLFGMYAVAPPEEMHSVLKAIVTECGAVTKGNIDAKDLQRAKNQLKASMLMSYENPETVFEDLATQTITTGNFVSVNDAVSKIDTITAQDITTLAKRLFNQKSTMAAAGNLINTPYLEQLL